MGKQFVTLFNDPAGGSMQALILEQQPDLSFQILGVTHPGSSSPDPVSVGGLLVASTAGVVDYPQKRFLTDTQLANLATLLPLATTPIEAQLFKAGSLTGCDSLLASIPTVNMNQDAATPLYTVPAGKSCIITKLVLRNSSGNLTTASISFGFISATYNDVVANAAYASLTGATLQTRVLPKAGQRIGTAGTILSVICNTKQGAPMTIAVDVYGYLY